MKTVLQGHWVKSTKRSLSEISASNDPDYKAYWDSCISILKYFHKNTGSSLDTCHLNSQLVDLLIEHLFEVVLTKYHELYGHWMHPVSLIAIGGYGRSELSPLSDVDIILLHTHKVRPLRLERLIHLINVFLVGPLKNLYFRVTFNSRTISDTIVVGKSDYRMLNAQLDSRLITGSAKLFVFFRKVYSEFMKGADPHEFILKCIDAQKQRHEKHDMTVFLQEPNIKNGVGGLRDYQNILWLARAKFRKAAFSVLEENHLISPIERSKLKKANEFLLRVRNELHFQTQRSADLLYMEQQVYVALNLGYKSMNIFSIVEQFMQDYYKHANNIHKINTLLIERLLVLLEGQEQKFSLQTLISSVAQIPEKHVDGFILSNAILIQQNEHVFQEDPIRLIRVFRHCQQFQATLHPELKSLIEKSLYLITPVVINHPDASRAFRSLLQSIGEVYVILSQMHDLGVLAKFIPEFEKITFLVQHEFYQRFTTDEHTLKSIEQLDLIFNSNQKDIKSYAIAIRETMLPSLLYLVLLFHDIGKSQGNVYHPQNSAKIAKLVLSRLGISEKQQESVLFLIKNHLSMMKTWQRFDVDDPDVYITFAGSLKDPEILKYLYVLTYCDAKATNFDIWNSYKDILHSKLYKNTLNVFSQQSSDNVEDRKRQKKEAYLDLFRQENPHFDDKMIEDVIRMHPDKYFMLSSLDEMSLHMDLVERLQSDILKADCAGSLMPVVHWKHDINQSLTIVTIVTWARPGLFASIAGAFAASGLSVISAKAFTRSDKIVIDTFFVIEADTWKNSQKNLKKIFESKLNNIIVNDENPMPDILALQKKISRSPRLSSNKIGTSIDVYHEIALKRTIVEVQTIDEIGLLYRIALSISNHGFDIFYAKINTEHGSAIDTFHIQKDNLNESTGTHDLILLREDLNRVISSAINH